MSATVLLNGEDLTPEMLFRISNGGIHVDLSPEAWARVEEARAIVDKLAALDVAVYGVNTGFGNFASVRISPDKISQLQVNLIRSHCAGVGEPLSPERTRMLLALRINTLAKGFSGIRAETLRTMIQALNSSCLSKVPCKGTLGASGDLAPLSHLALGLIGEGEMWDFETSAFLPAADVLARHGITPVTLGPKEGLAMINGTQMISALGCEAICRAKTLLRQADIVAALTLEVLKGSVGPFDERIHKARPHRGQILTAKRMRRVLSPASELQRSHRDCCRVQDSYTLRCTPQVHGVVHDTLEWVYGILDTEINSATDNPMVMTDTQNLISCGNFHGEYPAKCLDMFAIGIHELSQISERRIERLVNANLSELPPFLVPEGGLNSGFMIAHCTAAALVSENKVLCHPSSADSIPTSAAKEDHVSMGGFAARKALEVIDNVEHVVAIELLCACQALDFCRPLHTTPALEAVYTLVRAHVSFYDADRQQSPDIAAVVRLLRANRIWEAANAEIDIDGEGAIEMSPTASAASAGNKSSTACDFGTYAECEHKAALKKQRIDTTPSLCQ